VPDKGDRARLDLQRGGWNYFKGDWKLASDVKLTPPYPEAVRSGKRPRIVEMSAPSTSSSIKQPSSIAVRIAIYTSKPPTSLKSRCCQRKKADDSRSISANGTVAVRFRMCFDTPGDNPGSMSSARMTPRSLTARHILTRALFPGFLCFWSTASPRQIRKPTPPSFSGRRSFPPIQSPFEVRTLPSTRSHRQMLRPAKVVICQSRTRLRSGIRCPSRRC